MNCALAPFAFTHLTAGWTNRNTSLRLYHIVEKSSLYLPSNNQQQKTPPPRMPRTSSSEILPLSAGQAPPYHRDQMQELAELETRIAALSSFDHAKAITVRMCRIYLQHSYTQKGVEEARSNITGLIQYMRNADVTRLYEGFVKEWNDLEERPAHRLPLLNEKGKSDGDVVPDPVQDGTIEKQRGRNEKSRETAQCHDPQKQRNKRPVASTETVDTTLSPISIGATKGSSPTSDTLTLIRVINPEAFPTSRLQEVQIEYPSLHIISMWLNLNASNEPVQITADIANGPVNHLLIRDARIIAFFGLASSSPNPTIDLQPTDRIDETFTIRLIAGYEDPRDHEAWVVGELVSARHSYLYWLEERNSADPRGPPIAAEARAIARKTGRRALQVMNEIENYWKMEYGSGGQRIRERRAVFLGENPVFDAPGDGKMKRCMWNQGVN